MEKEEAEPSSARSERVPKEEVQPWALVRPPRTGRFTRKHVYRRVQAGRRVQKFIRLDGAL